MIRVNIKDCEDFISFFYSKIEIEGLMNILSQYKSKENIKDLDLAVDSLYQNLINGLSFQDSIKNMSFKFPLCIEDILINSIENSVLDYALKDMYYSYKESKIEDDLYDSLSLINDKYSNNFKTEIICEDCFYNEFEKILKRAEIENSYEIYLEQEKEKYFIQGYVGNKYIKYIEPSHSKTYNTILKKLHENYNSKLHIYNKEIFIDKIKENEFVISYNNIFIKIIFK